MKSLRDFNFKDKRALVRVDFNVPLSSDFRIKATLPTIEYLLKENAKIILLAHLGRPQWKIVEELRLDPVAKRLEELLNKEVIKLDDCCGEKIEERIKEMKSGEIIFLENLRFYPEEKENDEKFAKQLASYGDIYVNDAFGVNHRAHASLVGIPKYLPHCAGFLLEKEIKILSKVLENPKRPLLAIIGGAKISTKIKVIKKFLDRADNLLLGGALANTVIAAKGITIGRSVTEKGMEEEVKEIILTSHKLHLPVDAIASVDPSGQSDNRITPIGKTSQEEMILDVGPETNDLFKRIISQAKTIIWNGPMGLIEVDEFVQGSKEVARAVAQSDCFSVVGGGDSISLLEKMDLLDKIDHVSTGGGAMLKFLADEQLPGIEALN